MINKKELEQLLDDVKLISKAVKVMGNENDQIKRQYALGLVEDLMNRLYSDLQNLTEKTNDANTRNNWGLFKEYWN